MMPQLRSISASTALYLCWGAILLQCIAGFTLNKAPSLNKWRYDHSTYSQLSAAQLRGESSKTSFFDNLIKSISGGLNKGSSEKGRNPTQKTIKSSKAVRKIPKVKVIIIGTGMSGLASAIELQKAGCADFLMIDSADAPGGRVRTDSVDGYLLDRGFQVFIDSYPESVSIFDNDYSELQLKSFWPGALVHYG